MHNPWEEMIPFYLAGTLPRADTQRLERHLNGCDECRRSLESWRTIAGVVRAQASAQMRDLPPLSPRVLEQAAQSGRGRRSTALPTHVPAPGVRRYGSLPVTMIAAVITVVVFGGLLALMVLRGLPTPNATNVGLVPTATATEIAPPSGTPQIIIIEPSASPVVIVPTNTELPPTPIPPTPIPPTRQPLPTSQPPIVLPTAIPPDTATPPSAQPLAQIRVNDACTVHVSEPAINLFAGPGSQYRPLYTFSGGEEMTALAQSDNGLYNVEFTNGATVLTGWVQASYVYTSGSCEQLPRVSAADYASTPTTAVAEPPAALISNDNVNLRGGPGTIYPIVGTANSGQRFPIDAQVSSGGQVWYLITLAEGRSAWVYGALVVVVPNDAVIPPAATIPPPPTPTVSPTATPTDTAIPPALMLGNWSQITTVVNTTCSDTATGTSSTTTLTLIGNADTLTMTFADGTSFILYRAGVGQYNGSYTTDSARVSVTLTLISPNSYSGDAIATQSDGGCFVRGAWNGSYQGR